MNHTKSIFSPGLFREGLRQTRMIGILALVIAVLGAVLVPIGICIESASEANTAGVVTTAFAAEAWEIHPVLMIVLLAAPLMTLVGFHFLDTRAASDLYHALPHKRISLYLSYAAAVIFWTFLIIAVSSGLSVLSCLFARKYVILTMPSVLNYSVVLFLICLQIVSGMLIAISLSGTIFTNVLLSGILLFLPRVLATFLKSATLSSLPFVADVPAGEGFFSNANNLLISVCFAVMDFDDASITSIEEILSLRWQAAVYTLLLSLIYLGIGAWLFCRRRSEAAGQSAPSRMHQHVYRILVTMSYCLIVTGFLINDLIDTSMGVSEYFVYFVAYLIGILIYVIYELITTRKWKNLLTSLPGLGVVLVLNIAAILGMRMAADQITNDCPAASEIQSVSFGADYDPSSIDDWLDYYRYVDYRCSSIAIRDPAIAALISDNLDENIQTWKDSHEAYWNKYQEYSSGDIPAYTSYTVSIRTDSKTLYRDIFIPQEDVTKITAALAKEPAYTKVWKDLPEPIENTIYAYAWGSRLDGEKGKELFDSYLDEMNQASLEALQEKKYSDPAANSLTYQFRYRGHICNIDLPIFSDLMPETNKLLREMVYNLNKETADKLSELVSSGHYDDMSVDITGKTDSGSYNAYCYDSMNPAEIYAHLKDYILDEPIRQDGTWAIIHLYPKDYIGESITLTVALDSAVSEDAYLLQHLTFDYYREDGENF